MDRVKVEDYVGGRHELKENAFYHTEVFQILGTTERQEDSTFAELMGPKEVLIVCDGMGGLNGGDVASQTAIKAINDTINEYPEWHINPKDFILEAIKNADDQVCLLKNSEGKPLNAGCTLAILVLIGKRMYWGNVGDARIYFCRGNQIVQITEDHNYENRLQRELSGGVIDEETYKAEYAKGAALTSYIGIGGVREYYICEEPFDIDRDDVIMLMSDGLYKLVSDEEMLQIISTNVRDFERAGKMLLATADYRKQNYQDNTSFILSRMK